MEITRRDACKALAVMPLVPAVPVARAATVAQPTRVALAVKAAVAEFGERIIPLLPAIANQLSKPLEVNGWTKGDLQFYVTDYSNPNPKGGFWAKGTPLLQFATVTRNKWYQGEEKEAVSRAVFRELHDALRESPQDWHPDLAREPRPTQS